MASIILDDSTAGLSLGGGDWKRVQAGRYFGGSTIYAAFAVDRANGGDSGTYGSLSVTFQGTSISFHGNTPASSNSQNFFVSIDGGTPYETTCSDPTPQTNTQWYQSPILEEGTHTVAITHIAGTALDYMVVAAGPDTHLSGQQVIVDDDDREITYSGSWSRETGRMSSTQSRVGVQPYGNATHRSSTPGSSATFQFTGTAVEVYSIFDFSRLGNLGLTFTVDSTSIQESYSITPSTSEVVSGVSRRENYLLFSSPSLAPGDHTLKVELTSNTNQVALVLDYIVYKASLDTLAENSPGEGGSGTNSPTGLPSPAATSESSNGQASATTVTTIISGSPVVISGSLTVPGGVTTSVFVVPPVTGRPPAVNQSIRLDAVIGGVIGAVALLVLVLVSLLLFCRRKAKTLLISDVPASSPPQTSSRAGLLPVVPFTDAHPSPSFSEPKSAALTLLMTSTTASYPSSGAIGSEVGCLRQHPRGSKNARPRTPCSSSQPEQKQSLDARAMDQSGAIFRTRMQRLQDLVVELNRRITEEGEESRQVAELRERILVLTREDAESREGARMRESEMAVPPPYEPREIPFQ
ncbi:hypothetical protein LshimejAT787_1700520 [Lyophyllum shimeji]|uniref:Uncharacterized protein n=1 Tax=Lyophyllum shimeji TaxID=47721 RepID=A0A9P3UU72_LYOSH|nr:hypothetical protein LshimejAT787_1700520 [Lyophyllum shimeji]